VNITTNTNASTIAAATASAEDRFLCSNGSVTSACTDALPALARVFIGRKNKVESSRSSGQQRCVDDRIVRWCRWCGEDNAQLSCNGATVDTLSCRQVCVPQEGESPLSSASWFVAASSFDGHDSTEQLVVRGFWYACSNLVSRRRLHHTKRKCEQNWPSTKQTREKKNEKKKKKETKERTKEQTINDPENRNKQTRRMNGDGNGIRQRTNEAK
jgi:hypothetical protein